MDSGLIANCSAAGIVLVTRHVPIPTLFIVEYNFQVRLFSADIIKVEINFSNG